MKYYSGIFSSLRKEISMNDIFFKENKGYIIVVVITLILFCIALIIPTVSPVNDFVAKFGSLVTILGAGISYLAWSNTQKLIIRRKKAVLKTEKSDVIVGISALRQTIDIEDQIATSAENELYKELHDLANGSKISIQIDNKDENKIGNPNSVFNIRVSKKIHRGIVMDTPYGMPVDDPIQLEKYINDYRSAMEHLFCATPVSLAPFIMPYFVNKMTIIAYHWDAKNEKYTQLGPVDDR